MIVKTDKERDAAIARGYFLKSVSLDGEIWIKSAHPLPTISHEKFNKELVKIAQAVGCDPSVVGAKSDEIDFMVEKKGLLLRSVADKLFGEEKVNGYFAPKKGSGYYPSS